MRWSWPGAIALILAVGIAIALCVSLIVVALSTTAVSQQFASVLSALSGAAVGAVATYLGTTLREEGEQPKTEPDHGQDESEQAPNGS
jgi:threonine/homoserine/homoserine lactone efflux protein